MSETTRRDVLKALGMFAGGGMLARTGAARGEFRTDRREAGIRFGTQTNAMPIDPKNFATFVEALETIKGIGFEGFETGFRNVMGQFRSPAEARAKIAGTGLTFFAIHIFLPHAMYDRTTLIAPSSLYQQVALGGSALGAQNMVVSGAAAEDVEQLKQKIAGLNAAGRFSAEHGMGLAYHNEEPESGSKLNELDVLYTETDPKYVRFLFDVGHKFNVGGDVVGFIRKYSQRMIGLHLRDYRDHQQVVLGTGDLPLKEIARALRERHWSGWVETEEERLDGSKHGKEYLEPAYVAMKRAFNG